MNQVFEAIAQTVGGILTERGEPVPALTPDTLISHTGLDSMDIADLTLRLDAQIGRVPEEALRQYPKTLGELAELYGRYRESEPRVESART